MQHICQKPFDTIIPLNTTLYQNDFPEGSLYDTLVWLFTPLAPLACFSFCSFLDGACCSPPSFCLESIKSLPSPSLIHLPSGQPLLDLSTCPLHSE